MSERFVDFMRRREAAARAYVTGDAEPLDQLVVHSGQATFHSPGGESVSEAESVARRYREDAAAFKPEGVTHFEILQQDSGGELAFWTGYQVARAQIGDMPEPQNMKIRVTEVFRREAGEWKMIHRHADMTK